MNKFILLGAAILTGFMQPAHANPVSRRATITGVGGNGRCTIEVTVDHSAEVEVSSDTGLLTTVAGAPSRWRRFQCNTPLPANPVDFRFIRTAGRGTLRLVQDPRSTGGRAVIHIDDPQGGEANYTFDLQWRGPSGGWAPPPPPPGPGPFPGHGPGWGGGPGPGHGPGGLPTARVIRLCQDSVTDRLNRQGYRYVTFESTMPVDNSGRKDWITGTAVGKRGFGDIWFSFSCSVDFGSGTVRSVDVSRR
jgi:hypothetical protein